jgi:hypothetical protein
MKMGYGERYLCEMCVGLEGLTYVTCMYCVF